MVETDRKAHWEEVYATRGEAGVSWYQAEPRLSLDLIRAVGPPAGGRVIDVGGGASTLVDDLLAFSAKCTHEGCTVTFQPEQSVIWCPCHDGRFDLHGRVLSGPPPQPLPRYAVNRQADGTIVISEEKAA